MINYDNLLRSLRNFGTNSPFDHCVVDDFFEIDVARQLEMDFPAYMNKRWMVYDNALEHKKALNSWESFPTCTYRAFCELYSDHMLSLLSTALEQPVFADHGLNGGGWHIHGTGGNLNPHLDYSIHPKTGLERVINIIIYLSQDLQAVHGGHFGLWQHDAAARAPGSLAREIEPKFNRAVLFNTTQNSWHGMSRPLSVPEGIYRKSLAIYYMRQPAPGADERGRALFAPRDAQKSDPAILDIIRLRSDVATSASVYRTATAADSRATE